MGSPEPPHGNYDGYKNSDLTRQVNQFKGKNLFLVHGTSDTNVHFQQSKGKVVGTHDVTAFFSVVLCLLSGHLHKGPCRQQHHLQATGKTYIFRPRNVRIIGIGIHLLHLCTYTVTCTCLYCCGSHGRNLWSSSLSLHFPLGVVLFGHRQVHNSLHF